jgi:GDPmannose 4,6-dehydratase
LFNYESPLRPERFVTKKIIAAAKRIASGSREKLELGNTAIRRDWGWAPDYVIAMWKMLNRDAPEDFVIATGESHSLQEFVEAVFLEANLDWRDHVTTVPGLLRPSDPLVSTGNPTKAKTLLNWQPSVVGMDVPRKMYQEFSTINLNKAGVMHV